MNIIAVISKMNQPGGIYFLLTAYVEAILHPPGACRIPQQMLKSPIKCRRDIRACLTNLGHLRAQDGIAWTAFEREKLAETLAILRYALDRLEILENTDGAPAAAPNLCMV